MLVHYDEKNELVLFGDSLLFGLGAELAHRMRDGTERPIGFVSRTLKAAENNYSQIEKEGLVVVFRNSTNLCMAANLKSVLTTNRYSVY